MNESATPLTLSGASQEPLTAENQLFVGGVLTGTSWEHAWEICELAPLTIRRVTYPFWAPHTPGASHTFSNGVCVCGYRRLAAADVLPLDSGARARTWILRPEGVPVAPDPYSIYVTSSGLAITLLDGHWIVPTLPRTAIPVIPKLALAWVLPDALKALVE